MKKILLFLSFLLMSIGVFGTAATMTGISHTTAYTVNSKSGIKCGTGDAGGSMKITVPSGATSISFYISGWGSDGTTVSITPTTKVNKTSITPSVDGCFSGNGTTFTTNNSESTYACTIILSEITTSTDIIFSTSAKKKRFIIWGAEYTSQSYTITAQSNNNTYGIVSLSGNVITGSPNSGYRYASPAYSVSPTNSATVSQNGNEFTVTPSANTTVTINFEAIPKYTVNLNIDETLYSSVTQSEYGEEIDLSDSIPNISRACQLNGWQFVGWINSNDKNNRNLITTITPTKDTTLYALFKILTEEGDNIIDTLTYTKIGLGYSTGGGYTEFDDIYCNSEAEYTGQIYQHQTGNSSNKFIQLRATNPSGIVTSESGGYLNKVKIIWNSGTASGRKILIYTSDTALVSGDLYKSKKPYDTITFPANTELLLNNAKYIGIRSKENALYLDTIFITWSTVSYEYSINPKCFETNISVAEWHKNYVEFDIGNYDSIHTYNGPLNSCDSIRIKITNDNNEECIRWFHVPVFAGVNTIIDNLDCDVVILKDSTLTINSNISNNNVYVYPDGILHIKGNKTYTVNSLTLRRDNNDVPQFLYEGTLKVNDGMFFEMRSNNEDWRWLTLPDSIRIGEISDKPEVLLKYYDGNERAKNGRGGWKYLNKDSISGFGTIFGVNLDTDEKRIYKFRLDTNILTQEKSLANKHIKVKKFFYSNKPTNDLGWNLVGNPFMATYNVNTLFGVIFESDSLVKEIVNGQWTGRWITEEKDLRYIVVPSNKQEQHIIDAGGYEQICLLDGYKLPPFTSFFIQAKDGGDLVFYHGQREANAPSRKTTINENKESFLRVCIGSIKTGCYISNKFNDSYEIGDDMESLYSTYQLINGYKLLYSAINDSIIEHGIKVYTPAGNLHLDDKTNVEDFDEIYALYDGGWFDLLHGQTQDVSGEFILFAKRKNQETNPTDIDIIKDNKEVTKFMHNNNLYIKKNNHIFNILGGVIK